VPPSCFRFVRLPLRVAAGLLIFLIVGTPLALAGLPEVIARVKPSIVTVGTFQKLRTPPFTFAGTGFIVEDGTLVATAAHVVPEALKTESRETMMVWVRVPGASEPQAREATAIAVDREHDLALLRITGAPLPAVTLGDSRAVRDGQSIGFVGFPFGHALGLVPVTHRGIISASTPVTVPGPTSQQLDARDVRRLKSGPFMVFQLDAISYPGQSGSPVFDAETGEVIGVVNMALLKGKKDAALTQPTGISFAVPTQYLLDLIRSLR
jgi:S1-C subfamily serine protease